MSELTAAAPVPVARAATRVPPWLRLGVLFGLLSIAAIILYGPIGVSGTYPRVIGALLHAADPAYAGANPYLVKMGGLLKPETMLVVGLLIGGFLAARLGRRAGAAPAVEMVHPAETSRRRRYLDAFAGGLLIIFGARLAGGCTSGHIISGVTQLAVSGILFGAAVFGAGILTARLLEGGR
ncbi:MAG TPA: YeeE/YedE thiosulfate transporter family protein [Gemmatimonadaceae bacterium]|nr:YeeE/YedE thiosulfate transporter family protein [Gemmatimonadaceae bacterium]